MVIHNCTPEQLAQKLKKLEAIGAVVNRNALAIRWNDFSLEYEYNESLRLLSVKVASKPFLVPEAAVEIRIREFLQEPL